MGHHPSTAPIARTAGGPRPDAARRRAVHRAWQATGPPRTGRSSTRARLHRGQRSIGPHTTPFPSRIRKIDHTASPLASVLRCASLRSVNDSPQWKQVQEAMLSIIPGLPLFPPLDPRPRSDKVVSMERAPTDARPAGSPSAAGLRRGRGFHPLAGFGRLVPIFGSAISARAFGPCEIDWRRFSACHRTRVVTARYDYANGSVHGSRVPAGDAGLCPAGAGGVLGLRSLGLARSVCAPPGAPGSHAGTRTLTGPQRPHGPFAGRPLHGVLPARLPRGSRVLRAHYRTTGEQVGYGPAICEEPRGAVA